MELLFLHPAFQERIWGGTTLQQWFPQEHLGDHIGECWAISAHPNGCSVITNGLYQGKSLQEVYALHPELFGQPKQPVFPLLVKILDASADLSVQVHPDDTYALSEEGELGKTECWYVLDAKPEAKIIYGHTAQTKTEFVERIETGAWKDLLLEQPVKKGDFFYVPSGTIHALCAGTLVLEVQQSSDTTYRLYDYDRLDDAGNKRALHIEKSIAVTTIPHQPSVNNFSEYLLDGQTVTTLVRNAFFTVEKIDIQGELTYKRQADYVLVTVISGEGEVEQEPLTRGTSFIIPHTVDTVSFKGELTIIISYI